MAESKPNRSRPRVYDAEQIAVSYRETFAGRPVELRHELPFTWPDVLQHVGDSLAVAYASDKWEKRRADGTRFIELFKHLAESRNRVLVRPGLLYDDGDRSEPVDTIGPLVSLVDAPMPKHFAVLGLFEEASLDLHTGGTDDCPLIVGDQGVVRVEVRHGVLGASKIRWSETRRGAEDQPFLFVYTEHDGAVMSGWGSGLS